MIYNCVKLTNEAEQVVRHLDAHKLRLPTVSKLTKHQLIALARVYREHEWCLLCNRLRKDDWLPLIQALDLGTILTTSLQESATLGSWVAKRIPLDHIIIDMVALRDIWILDILANHGVTVDTMLTLSNTWPTIISRRFNHMFRG